MPPPLDSNGIIPRCENAICRAFCQRIIIRATVHASLASSTPSSKITARFCSRDGAIDSRSLCYNCVDWAQTPRREVDPAERACTTIVVARSACAVDHCVERDVQIVERHRQACAGLEADELQLIVFGLDALAVGLQLRSRHRAIVLFLYPNLPV